MLFNSYAFLFVFLPIAVAGYYALAHGFDTRAAKIWLCLASFVFYGWWNPAFVLLLLGSIAFNYTLSTRLAGEDTPGSHHSALLAFGVIANLMLLSYYKYLFPLLGLFHDIGWSHIDYGSVILPIGISFFTFTQIGYLVDCRQGVVTDRGLLNYVLFVTFFPHLIAGPILHHREIMPQFADEANYRFRPDYLAIGLTLFAVGLCKKVLLADAIAPWAEAGFAHPVHIDSLNAWSAALAYSMQIYFDFSGYSDMAIGIGIMFCIKLPLNFNSPYKSASIIDFWQRWHMTLTRYLTLLIYNPIALWVGRRRQAAGLSMSRQAAATPSGFLTMIGCPTMATMFLAGVWHGAGLQYIVFGALHGSYLMANHAWRLFRPAERGVGAPAAPGRLGMLWPIALTYFCVLLAQVFFRANSASEAVSLVAGAVGLHGSGLPLPIPLATAERLGPLKDVLVSRGVLAIGLRDAYNSATLPLIWNSALAIGLAVIAFGAPNVYQVLDGFSPALQKVPRLQWKWLAWKPNVATAIGTGVAIFVATLYFHRAARFLYFQF
jgi:D-alanyl-lipoteichoic acid acyltransferase DltB (MBOAT superfamily)